MRDVGFAHNPRTLLPIARYLRERSISPREVFKRAEISPSDMLHESGWLPRELCFKLGVELEAIFGDCFPGAEIGNQARLADFGLWGQAAMGASTLEEACRTAVSGVGLLLQGAEVRFRLTERHALVSFAYAGRSNYDPLQHVLGSLAVLRNVALLADVPEAVGARFAFPSARYGDGLEKIFGSSIEFDSGFNGIVIDRDILNFKLRAKAARAEQTDPLKAPAVLAGIVKAALPYDSVTLDRIAPRLGLSSRTLQRRLHDWGFSFEEMVDDIRRTTALHLVRSETLSGMEMAFSLGYSDPAHFVRAFRRWTNMTPGDYRQRALQTSADGTETPS
ncbi:AraC family transcriptional regulator [Methyloceanibacter sp.]|uniref:helix-turn-helix domain-containing protein n=1 Tax=Methyloceanibacter sp. TaxID=1965321 RepID=UPI0020876D9B|nr:AraC family transcriptional regulator [Methyloceanibacter sp.]GFO81156.1 MAG: transcriptional regulator [Methyloceanibacter sp.]HML91402.1 AraC family transcriptional regulator ligand-binding domain-containing protein [Methyloceanibacter sp.]